MKEDTQVLELAVKALSRELNKLLEDCMNGDVVKKPSYKSVMRARGCLPKQYSMGLIKNVRKNTNRS